MSVSADWINDLSSSFFDSLAKVEDDLVTAADSDHGHSSAAKRSKLAIHGD